MLPWGGLHPAGLHELKPLAWRDGPSAAVLALMLAGQRILGPATQGVTQRGRPPALVLWASAGRTAAELGKPHGPGLAALGIPPGRLLLVDAARTSDALWALEEGLASGLPAAVIGLLDALDAMAARRLSLAARSAGTPCLVLTGPDSEPAPAAHTRWRVGAAAGGEHPFDEAAPGARRFALHLERCRQGPQGLGWIVEWCDETRRFHLVSALADREAESGRARAGAR